MKSRFQVSRCCCDSGTTIGLDANGIQRWAIEQADALGTGSNPNNPWNVSSPQTGNVNAYLMFKYNDSQTGVAFEVTVQASGLRFAIPSGTYSTVTANVDLDVEGTGSPATVNQHQTNYNIYCIDNTGITNIPTGIGSSVLWSESTQDYSGGVTRTTPNLVSITNPVTSAGGYSGKAWLIFEPVLLSSGKKGDGANGSWESRNLVGLLHDITYA